MIRVLLIEDDPADLLLLQEMLAGDDAFALTAAGSLAAGMALLAENPFDLLLLDTTLPDSQGLAALESLPSAGHDLPVVLLTGQSDPTMAGSALGLGAEEVLAKKEISARGLLRTLRYAASRHKLVSSLRASEAQQRLLLESSVDAILVVDEEGVTRYANPAAGALFGRPLADLVGQQTGFSPDAFDQPELSIRRQTGENVVVEPRRAAIQWQGQPALLVTLHDITARHQAEEARRLSEERYRRLAQATFEGLVWSERGVILDANEQFARMFGYEAGELVGMKVLELVAPASRELVRGNIAAGFEESYEHLAQRRDGTVFPAEVRGKMDPYQGRLVRVSALRDLTERVEAEKSLRRVERALRTLSDCNQALVRLSDEPALVQEICRLAVDVGGYRLAWVAYAGQDEEQSVRPVAWAGHEAGYLSAIAFTWADTPQGHDPTGSAIRSGHPVVVQDIAADPSYALWRDEALARGYAGTIALPLRVQGQVLGALRLYADEPHAFDPEEIALLQELANDLAYGIDARRERLRRAGAEEELKRRDAILEAVSFVAERLLRAARWQEEAPAALARLGQAAGASRAYIFQNSLGAEGERLASQLFEWVAPGITPQIDNPALQRIPYQAAGFGRWQATLSRGLPVHGPVATFPPEEQPLLVSKQILSLAVVPIIVDEAWWGWLGFDDCRQPRAWSDPELDALAGAAGILAAAIRRQRADEAVQASNRSLLALLQVSQRLAATLSPPEILRLAGQAVTHELPGAPHCAVALLDQEGQRFHCAYAIVDGEETPPEAFPSFTLGEGPISQAIRSRAPLAVDLAQIRPELEAAGRLVQIGDERQARSALYAPLVAAERVLGALCAQDYPANAFDEQDLAILSILAASTAAALESARLYQTELARRQEAERLRDLAAALSSSLDLDNVLEEILRLLEQVVAFDRAAIFLLEEDGLLAVAGRSLPPEARLEGRLFPAGDALFQAVRRTAAPLILADARLHPDYHGWAGTGDTRGWMGLPLISQGQVIGCLTVDSLQPAAYGPEEAALTQAFANQAGQAISNARLLARTRRQVRFQRTLNAVMAAAAAAPGPREMAEQVLAEVLKGLDLPIGAVWMPEAVAMRGLSAGVGAVMAGGLPEAANEAIGQPLAVSDWTAGGNDELWQAMAPLMASFGVAASLTAPIMAEGRRAGGLAVAAPAPRRWQAEELALLQAAGHQIGAAAERLRLLHRVRQQAEQMQRIIQAVPEGVLVLDPGGQIVLANPPAEAHLALLGEARPGDVLLHLGGVPLRQLLAPPAPGREWQELELAQPKRLFETAAQEIRVEGASLGWVLLLRDVTEMRQQQELAQRQERLAMVGQLAAGIAHDFNNIIAVITLYSQLLQRRPDSPKLLPYLQTIEQQGEHAARLVQQILDFSRRSVMERTPLGLIPLLKEMLKLLQRTMPENIRLEFNYEEGEFQASVDPTRLQQAVMNLAVNARDAMPQGGVLRFALSHLALAPGQQAPLPDLGPGEWIRLTISDNGAGIEPEVLPHIFDPFFTTKQPGKGTGLGLAQVDGIIQQHDGAIGVSSRVGEGTTFEVYLPALALPDRPRPSGPPEELIRGEGETILVVEDNDQAREAVTDLLKMLGYRVLVAGDGEEALAVYRENAGSVDLVLTDLVMPAMDGRALFQALRQIDPTVRVVVMTGYPLQEGGRALLEEGFVAWLQKPYSTVSLAAAVRANIPGR